MIKPVFTIKNPAAGIYHADCRTVLPQLGSGKIDLAFADPPFNYGESYDGWSDTMTPIEFHRFTNEWIALLAAAVRDGGSIWLNVPVDMLYGVLQACSANRLGLRRDIIWHYRFGQHTDRNFIPSHTHLLYYVKDPNWLKQLEVTCDFTFNGDDILVPSDRATKYNDKRTRGKKRGTDGMRLPFDVWTEFPRVTGNSRERRPGHPNQMPERLLERIILVSSNPGDIVLDPFLGSGTTMVVARALGRRAVGIEVGAKSVKSAIARVKKGAVNVPFT